MRYLKTNICTTMLLAFLGVFLVILTLASAEDQPKVEPPAPLHLKGTDVRVSGRQLIVNGKPFVMKGISYNPVRKGETHPSGLMTLKPTSQDLVALEQDFKMMHEAGINTIRTYEPILDSRILDLLTKYQLHTIVPICANCKKGLYDFSSTIETLKDQPSTLIWEIGNEWNYNCFYSTEKGGSGAKETVLNFKDCVTLVKTLTAYIKTQDQTHPVSTDIGNIPEDHNELLRLLKSIDLCGMNVYDGLTFGDRFQRWKALTDKPLYIGECGADSYNELTHSYDPKDQAIADESIIKEAFNNLSAKDPNNILVGLCVFEWNDEWWKAKAPNESLSAHTTGGFKIDVGGPYPDHFANEEWWGVVDMDRHTRPAYDVLKNLFTAKASN